MAKAKVLTLNIPVRLSTYQYEALGRLAGRHWTTRQGIIRMAIDKLIEANGGEVDDAIVGMDELESVLRKTREGEPLSDYDREVAAAAMEMLARAIQPPTQVTVKQMIQGIRQDNAEHDR